MSTRKEVAERAGVSQAVVSYVINNSNYVSAEKRAAVLDAIRELDYHPNFIAKSLRQRKTNHFAVLAKDLRNEMSVSLIYYLEKAAYSAGYFTSVTSIDTPMKATNYLSTLMGRSYDGILLISNIYSEEQINKLAESGFPIVLFQYRFYSNLNPGVSAFVPQMFEAAEQAVGYLIEERGHKMIGYLTDGDPEAISEGGPWGQGFRANGYLSALEHHGVPVPEDWIYFLESQPKYRSIRDGICKMIQRFKELAPDQRPTAFFCGTDSIAATLIVELQCNGFSVPGNVEVIGFGDTYSSTITNPAITTIGIDYEQAAESILNMLICKAAGENVPSQTLPLKLIKRQSA